MHRDSIIKWGNSQDPHHVLKQIYVDHRERKFNEDSYIYEKGPKYSFAMSPKNRSKDGRNSLSPGPGSYNNSFSEFSERSKRIFEILNRL